LKTRIKIVINGAVQGVGFRPFVFNLAKKMNLTGFVLNDSIGVTIEAESTEEVLKVFLLKVQSDKPSLAIISSFKFTYLDLVDYDKFEIRKSTLNKEVSAFILPDIAVCNDCLKELYNPGDRRYLYPFINCTNCGPRLSIIESLPYDRPNTSMKIFDMCKECIEEYENPLNRRFHAQPIACPNCGPQLELLNSSGEKLFNRNTALTEMVKKIRDGNIIALKGIGGFQLIVDAYDEDAVKRLRKRKLRSEKPFALMFHSIAGIKEFAAVSTLEEQLLISPQSPIVLLNRIIKGNKIKRLAKSVAPGNPYLGIMLPYSPLHHLIMNELKSPIIATSANLSDEPICIDEVDALSRLTDIADYYLVHNRPIVRQVDDSIAQIGMGREMIHRRARGYAPLPIQINKTNSNKTKSYLAVGGHLKNSIAVNNGKNIFMSQHIGDLSTVGAVNAFEKTVADFQLLYNINIEKTICDLHPDYVSTKYADEKFAKVRKVQHHIAHLAACRAENDVDGDALSVCWDGTGYGLDDTIWGGEFFISNNNTFEHIGRLRQFHLAGGDKAVKDCRRSALGILYELFEGDHAAIINVAQKYFHNSDLKLILQMLEKRVNTVQTSSAGRLFDGVSSLLNICQNTNYEGQAAMMLEFSADKSEQSFYPIALVDGNPIMVDWQPMIEYILKDLQNATPISIISARFHNTLVLSIVNFAEKISLEKILLSGGCFQNIYLLENTITKLRKNGFIVYWHQQIPTNDGGIAAGQLFYELTNCKIGKTKNYKQMIIGG